MLLKTDLLASSERLLWFRETGVFFPFFTISSTISKSADVLFQQIFILSLLLKLREFRLSDKNNLILFGTAFFVVHTPLIISMSYSALLFIIPSVFAGFIFAYLILNLENGFFYSTAIHLLFYYFLGVILR